MTTMITRRVLLVVSVASNVHSELRFEEKNPHYDKHGPWLLRAQRLLEFLQAIISSASYAGFGNAGKSDGFCNLDLDSSWI